MAITQESNPTRPFGRRHRGLALSSLGALVLATIGGLTSLSLGVAGAATPTVEVATAATYGTILTNSSGFALYTLDTDHNGQSTCHGACAAVWPPLDVPSGTAPTGGPGVTGTLGTAKQSDGTFQVTYNGSPLYTFVSDPGPGQVTGNDVTGFFVVTVTGTTTTTTTTSPGTTPAGTTPAGTSPAGTTATPGTPAPVSASSGPASSTAPTGAPVAGRSAATPGTLAFTGAGPALGWLVGLGLLLLIAGAVIAFRSAGESDQHREVS
jgi:predicted lipoprotein with Yx(FWY)xxD motif